MEKQSAVYTFSARMWYSEWYFVSLPGDMSGEIRANFGLREQGWGRLKATAAIGGSEWETAIWFDTKSQTYLLPIKKEIRAREKLAPDAMVTVSLRV